MNTEKTYTDKELIRLAKNLYGAIYDFECFASHDLREYEWVCAELEKRGYEITESKTISIEKIEENEEGEVS
ncbi:MAG TPA: hypothetical protein P5136_02600 [Methanofastidiosum sp.]|nr:hypothetical protein [Methanofastidiosum sp.]